MQIIVTERQSYNEDRSITIFILEKIDDSLGSYIKRTPIFTKQFMTGYNRKEKVRKIAQRRYNRCISVLFNRRVAYECENDYDDTVRECAKIRLDYVGIYFKKEKG